MLRGKGISQGIGIGKALVLKKEEFKIEKTKIENIEKELEKLEVSLNSVIEETETLNHADYDVSPDTNNDNFVSLNEAFIFARNLDTWDQMGYYNPFYPPYILNATEIPQSAYESSFSQNYMTIF